MHAFFLRCHTMAFAYPLYIRLGLLTGRRLSEKKGKKVLIRSTLLKHTALLIPNQNGFNFYLKEHSCLNLFLHQSSKHESVLWTPLLAVFICSREVSLVWNFSTEGVIYYKISSFSLTSAIQGSLHNQYC